jgi:hypothetical protein
MSTLQVRLNGTPIRGRIEGLESFTVTYSRDEQTGATQKAYTNELKFYDDGFDLIFNTLVASQQGLTRFIKVEIWDECCNDFIYRDFIIKGDSVDYCTGDCFVTARMVRQDEDERIYECFKTTPITTNLEEPNGSFRPGHWLVDPNNPIAIPKIPYCTEMRPAAIWYTILALVQLVFALLSLLNAIISAIVGNNNPLNRFINTIGEFISGCGRAHPSPYIVNYIGEAAKYCNCNTNQPFISSIFTDVNSRYNTVAFVNAPVRKGVPLNSPTRYIVENRPRQTITEFLNMVASDFNANWWIENGVLRMERKDYYLNSPLLLDTVSESKRGNILNGVCFKYNQGRLYSSQRIEATEDGTDKLGNTKLKAYGGFFDYRQIYNYPQGYEAWTEIKELKFSYSPIAFRPFDGNLNGYPLIGLLQTQFPIIAQFGNAAVFNDDEFLVHKYYECDPNSPDNNKRPRYGQLSQFDTINNQWVTLQNGVANPVFNIIEQNNFNLNTPNIYKDFHAIDDPILNPFRFWDYEVEAKLDCVMVRNMSVNRTVLIQTPYNTVVRGKINSIIANFGDRTIRITGEF